MLVMYAAILLDARGQEACTGIADEIAAIIGTARSSSWTVDVLPCPLARATIRSIRRTLLAMIVFLAAVTLIAIVEFWTRVSASVRCWTVDILPLPIRRAGEGACSSMLITLPCTICVAMIIFLATVALRAI
jgi:hypothetical protein